MNRPYTGLAGWIFSSYRHVCINGVLSAYGNKGKERGARGEKERHFHRAKKMFDL
jgi:hypothetical protein